MPDEKKEKKPAAPPAGAIKPKKKKRKPSVLKRIRQDKKKRKHNYSIKKALDSLLKKVRAAIISKDKEKASELFRALESALDRAAHKGIIHINKARRHKSSIAKKLYSLLSA